jgi:hypothetical protein
MKHLANRLNRWLIIILFSVLLMVPAMELKAAFSKIKIATPTKGTTWVKNAKKTIFWEKFGPQCSKVNISLFKGAAKIIDFGQRCLYDPDLH